MARDRSPTADSSRGAPRTWWVATLWLLVMIPALGACRGSSDKGAEAPVPSAPTASGPSGAPSAAPSAAPTTTTGTQVITYDPSTAEPAGSTKLAATCGASTAIPGSYVCTTEAGGQLEPCFVLDGADLVCKPNPVMGSGTYVEATQPLPDVIGGEVVAFAVALAGSRPPCFLYTGAAKELAGQPVTYACDAPGAWIVGPLATSADPWTASYVITDSSGTEVTTPPEAVDVLQAWVAPAPGTP